MSTSDLVRDCYLAHGALTVRQTLHILKIPTERIRRFVKPPYYRPVAQTWTGRGWETTWAYCDQVCECGQPAWYYGRVLMKFSYAEKVITMLLCQECRVYADAAITVSEIEIPACSIVVDGLTMAS